MLRKIRIVIFSTVLSWSFVQSGFASGFSFRFYDNAGAIHIGSSVPPEFVANGYDVLNDRGRVVDTILPKAARDSQTAKMLAVAEARHKFELQRSKDETLLRFYSSAEDVERVRQRKIQEFDNFIEIQRGNILSYRSRIAALQHQAADLERARRKVPQDILDTLSTLEENISDAEGTIKDRKQQKQKIQLAFNEDIRRLKILLGSDS